MKYAMVITLSDRNGSQDWFLSANHLRLLRAAGAGALLLLVTLVALTSWSLLSRSQLSSQLLVLQEIERSYIAAQEAAMAEPLDPDLCVQSSGGVSPSSQIEVAPAEVMVAPVQPLPNPLPVVGASTRELAERQLLLKLIPNGSPLKTGGKVSSGFGPRMHPVLQRSRQHKGADFRAPLGTPVYATADGVVNTAIAHSDSGYGRYIVIEHRLGFTSLYAHLNEVKVRVGDRVSKQTLLGTSGNSGLSRSAHLHYEVRYNGKALNPVHFTRWSADRFEALFTNEKGVPWQSLRKHSNQWLELASSPSSPKAAL